jgi:hypothetical protein
LVLACLADNSSPSTTDAATLDASDAGGGASDSESTSFSVDMTKGPAGQFRPSAKPQRVSDYIYGINAGLMGTSISVGLVARATRWGLVRQGGDAYTPWNWTNNYNNAGSDYCFYQGVGLGGDALAGTITASGDTIPAAQNKSEAFLATVPIVDFVAAADSNVVNTCPVSGAFCDGTTQSTRVNPNDFPFATDPDAGEAGGPAFVPNVAVKPGGNYCSCDSECDGGCEVATSPVYQDEFVHFLKGAYGTGSPVFFSLDNEPNYWGGTHPELWPSTGTLPCQTYTVSYDDIVSRDVPFASAIKAAWPQAKVFGPVVAQDGLIYAHSYSDPHWPTEFLDYYLQQMASASVAAGRTLLDVLDVHYYAQDYGNSPPGPAQCVQSPRLFWDPDYTSLSAAETSALDFGWTGPNDYFTGPNWYPRRLIPRLLSKIAKAYPSGTAPDLSISEYNNGCESDISGGLAQADMLGIFGREGVWAAAAWPLQALTDNYLLAAFDLYRNYDGNGAVVGDTGVYATTSDAVDTSVYAFAHSDDASALDLVVVNKTSSARIATIRLTGAHDLARAVAYHLVDGAAVVVAVPTSIPIACDASACSFTYAMPPMSATTVVVRAKSG